MPGVGFLREITSQKKEKFILGGKLNARRGFFA